ncbi:alpha-(1,3)-fucosyltransferase 10 isoform X3 [Tachysurus fulvidraco]|uniref:alpha-(1,3)-fucosyltransferase 10 isoform X3 n=1 Tax=Tachysurus fulvidraco TaxID=1234273 RepID=UPI001FEFFBB9|nr:alpha-(1,3)-fucosyltransferase 10 isoform X3 [Tachysurus fulvidraco]
MTRLSAKKLLACCVCASGCVFIFITLQVVMMLGQFEQAVHKLPLKDREEITQIQAFPARAATTDDGVPPGSEGHYPIIVWWSPLTGELGRLGECGHNRCFFTVNKSYHSHPSTQAFLFYGTDFSIESLPLPRKQQHHWALFHEESPKNNYKLFHKPLITLFNHTATFSHHSHLPLTTQHLESLHALTSHTFLLPLARKNQLRHTLAPVVYVQSDCDPPSDRDVYVQELRKHIPVDSYGQCLHNKDLPFHLRDSSAMDEESFYQILAQYKFILAFENAICDDYITEKLWRPLKLGVVPVYYGAPNVNMWLPSNRSAIVVDPKQPPEKLAQYLNSLDKNDQEYLTYLDWKLKQEVTNQRLFKEVMERQWGVQDITRDNFIDVFECMVCNRVWENKNRQNKGLVPRVWQAEEHHLTCPPPKLFDFAVDYSNSSSLRHIWRASYEQSVREAQALRQLTLRNRNFTAAQFWREVFQNWKASTWN